MLTSPCSFAAVAVGSAFPSAPFGFAVHSVFRRAANIKPSKGGFLLSLVSQRTKMHPRAAFVPGALYNEWGLRPGIAGVFDGGSLRFGGEDQAAVFPFVSIPRSRSSPESEGPSRGTEPFDAERRREILRSAYAATDKLRKARGIKPSLAVLFRAEALSGRGFEAAFVRAVRRLGTAVDSRSLGAILLAARDIVGLGPGLTPSGDDFLCGCLAGLRSRAFCEKGLGDFLDRFAAAVPASGILGRTDEISAAFLSEAVHGHFGAALLGLAGAVVHGGIGEGCGEKALEEAIAALAAIGHSSGTDAAAGFLFAFRDCIGGWKHGE